MQPTNDSQFRELRNLAAGCCAALLALHYYYFCHLGFARWSLTHPIADRLAAGIAGKGLLRRPAGSLALVLMALAATTIGAKAPPQVKLRRLLTLLASGLPLYFGAFLLLRIDAPRYK